MSALSNAGLVAGGGFPSSASPDAGELSEPAVLDAVVEQPTATSPAQPASESAAAVILDRKKKRVLRDNKRTAYVSSRGSWIVAPKGLASRMVTRRVPLATPVCERHKWLKFMKN